MYKGLIVLIKCFVLLGLLSVIAGFTLLHIFSRGLPDYQQLKDYELPVVTRLYASDGRVMNEYAVENRVYVPINSIPRHIIDAFLAAEDANFFTHPGIDLSGLLRATFKNLGKMYTNKRLEGASTITQQVAKNFLLNNEVSFKRKIREMILAFRIERAIPKKRILELYLNKLYMGFGSYGVASAALNYFDKGLNEISLDEAAYLASLPKAPNNYHPIRKKKVATVRRNYILDRMVEMSAITADQAAEAKTHPLELIKRKPSEVVRADYFSEETRRFLADKFGYNALYSGGLVAHTTLDPDMQRWADNAFRKGLQIYDRRHGYRGPHAKIQPGTGWQERLAALPDPEGILPTWHAAVILSHGDKLQIGFKDGSTGQVPGPEFAWGKNLSTGSVILVEPIQQNEKGKAYPEHSYTLKQIPKVNGGLVALDPHTGRVLAMTGGFSYTGSQFIRPTQAYRQTGSAFKPFIYLAALENGMQPNDIILDAPIAFKQGPGLPMWRPRNYEGKFLGPTLFRTGLELSRNVMTVRIAHSVGLEKIRYFAKKFGAYDKLPNNLAIALGAQETTLLRLTTAFGMFANGGKWISPSFVDRVQDRHGKTIYRSQEYDCLSCKILDWHGQNPPIFPDEREQVASPESIYQLTSILEGAVQRGTGQRLKSLGKTVAAKTGTTNDFFDGWMIAYNSDIVVGAHVGYDRPKTLGHGEAGARIAAPILEDFLKNALANSPDKPTKIPPGIRLVRINRKTGKQTSASDPDAIWEAFKVKDILDQNRSSLGAKEDNEGSMIKTPDHENETATEGVY